MRFLIFIVVAIIPFTILGKYVGGRYISPAIFFSFVIACVALTLLLYGQYKMFRKSHQWIFLFQLFVLVALLSLMISHYKDQAMIKGIIQIGGILVMLLMVIAVTNEIRKRPIVFLQVLSVAMITLGIIGAIGIAQFISCNVLQAYKYFNFSFMNDFAGGVVWNDPGYSGNLYRVNSIALEPAHFAQYLGFGAGLALIRLGFLGKALQKDVRPFIPLWSSWCVIIGMILSLSIIGYFLLILVAGFTWILSHRIVFKSFSPMIPVIIFIVVGIYIATHFTGTGFQKKMGTLPLIITAQTETIGAISSDEVSAFALASNIEVMLSNLTSDPLVGAGIGAHPASYLELAPSYVWNNEALRGLNSEDAGGLLIRLLSETGLLGTILYVAGFSVVILLAKRAIQWSLKKQVDEGTSSYSPFLPSAIGITASCAALFLIYLARFGVYYHPELWMLIALTACVPQLLRSYQISQQSVWAKL